VKVHKSSGRLLAQKQNEYYVPKQQLLNMCVSSAFGDDEFLYSILLVSSKERNQLFDV